MAGTYCTECKPAAAPRGSLTFSRSSSLVASSTSASLSPCHGRSSCGDHAGPRRVACVVQPQRELLYDLTPCGLPKLAAQ